MTDYFVKVWKRIVRSSFATLDDTTKWLFMCLLCEAESDGTVYGTIEYLAAVSRKTEAEVEAAMAELMAPDPRSTSKEHEGRRVLETGPNEWFLINYEKYRKANLAEERRAKDAERKQKARTSADECGQVRTGADECGQVGSGSDSSHSHSPSSSSSTSQKKSRRFTPPALDECIAYAADYMKSKGITGRNPAERFHNHFESNGWKVSGRAAMKDWKGSLRNWILRDLDDGRLKPSPEDEVWMYDTYRKACYEEHGNHSRWAEYQEWATMQVVRTALPFTSWLKGLKVKADAS